jgi:hypothetical protein
MKLEKMIKEKRDDILSISRRHGECDYLALAQEKASAEPVILMFWLKCTGGAGLQTCNQYTEQPPSPKKLANQNAECRLRNLG